MKQYIAGVLVCLLAGAAQAANITADIPTNFTMVMASNYTATVGDTGSYNYTDKTGVQLTDGFIGTGDWTADLGNGNAFEWVGWDSHDPSLTFNFADSMTNIKWVRIGFDRSDYAGISMPANVTINGEDFPVPADAIADGTRVFLDFTGNWTGDELDIDLTRSNLWVFVDEVQFSSTLPVAAAQVSGLAANTTALAGGNLTLGANIVGDGTVLTHWFFNGTPVTNNGTITGAENSTLMLSNLTSDQGGDYKLVVNNALNSANSTIHVIVSPTVSFSGNLVPVVAGANTTLTGSILGIGNLTYQWTFNGTPVTNGANVSGATSANLTLANLTATRAGNYTLKATNEAGNATAQILVVVSPVVSLTSNIVKIKSGANTVLTANVAGNGNLTYQWSYKGVPLVNGANVTGVTSANLTLSNLSVARDGGYTLKVTNEAGNSTATFTVLVAPAITTPPKAVTAKAKASAKFKIVATGSAPLTYLWLKSTTPLKDAAGKITGSKTASLTILKLAKTDAGKYSCKVTNPAGTVTSVPVALTVK